MLKNQILFTFFIAFLLPLQIFAQADSTKQIVQKYEGTWFNKKDNRYITINTDTINGDITINDWTGKRNAAKATNIDAYKVFQKTANLFRMLIMKSTNALTAR